MEHVLAEAWRHGARTATLQSTRMWPTAFALTELTAAEEERIGALVERAVS